MVRESICTASAAVALISALYVGLIAERASLPPATARAVAMAEAEAELARREAEQHNRMRARGLVPVPCEGIPITAWVKDPDEARPICARFAE